MKGVCGGGKSEEGQDGSTGEDSECTSSITSHLLHPGMKTIHKSVTVVRDNYVYGSERDELAVPSQGLVEAALSGDVEFVTESLKSKTVDVNYTRTISLKVLESEFGNTELLQMILQYSTEDIIKHDGLGLTPTMVSVKAGHTEAFRLLIDGRADISEKSRDCQPVVSLFQNRRALHFAARVGNLPAIVQLLEMGFPINSVDDSGHSPLMLASREGHAYACKLLLQRGVDCRIVNLRGETAISLAR
ncbi:hypothetical protein D5086_003791 [Populus alba]|uniref:Uncharacterized protein n=1 Tax=Populus alba TaxID=43335 RepID=A0ACC4D802_POPAL